jgi:hypothetical protein
MKGIFALKHKLRLTLAAILAVAALGAIAPAANAYIYWADAQNPPRIQRADNDGTNRVENFVLPAGASDIFGVAVDANYIYWTDPTAGTIGRANLDGSNANNAFIDEIPRPMGLAVDAGHIYWASDNPNNATVDYLYKANLNGTTPTVIYTFAAGLNPMGIAVDSTYIYWTQRGNGKLGRATLNFSTSNQSWITATSPSAVAVNASHVYWANFVNAPSDSSIGRANIGSTSQNQSFVTGAKSPYGIALDSSYLYWGNSDTTSIGRSGLDGSSPNQSFVTNAGDVRSIAANALDPVGSLTPSSNAFGNQLVSGGASSAATFTLTSSGSANLTIPASGVTLTGTNADQFQVSGGTCSAGSSSLSNAQTCTVTVTFDPSSTGAKSATLEVQTNDGTKTTTLTGSGIAPAGSLSPSAYDFDGHYVATETQATFTLTSSGSADLDLEGISFSGVGAENFGFTDAGTCSVQTTSLSNGQSCTVVVNFSPYTSGFKSATLMVATNDGPKTADMTGVGIVDPTIVGSGKPTKVSLKVKIGCGDDNACLLQLTGKKVGTNAAVTPKTISVGAGQQPVVTLAYSKALKKAIAKGGRIAVTATNNTSNTSKSVTVNVPR